MGNAFEIDFLAVGDGKCSGDAIALRAGNLTGPREQQFIAIIDGGTKETGEQLVTLVQNVYGADDVNLVVNTHPDRDHSSGLTVVLEKLHVPLLLMHEPWTHGLDVRAFWQSRAYLTDSRIEEAYRRSLQNVEDLKDIAARRGTKIVEPFSLPISPAVMQIGDPSVRILGPSKEHYESLLPGILGLTDTPEAQINRAIEDLLESYRSASETLDPATETLDDTGATSPTNNSSVILHFLIEGQHILFTGDAGIEALTHAADYAAAIGLDLTALRFLQVPHHGSRRNVGPTILDRIKGKTAFISAAADGMPKHPSQRVINALIRRGATVYATRGTSLRQPFNAGPRPGYGPVDPLPFKTTVEAIAA